MLLLTAPLASLVMLLALRVEQRLGPVAGGWTAALPLGLAAALAAVMLDQGSEAAGAVALSAAGHAPAQVAFGIAAGAVMVRAGVVAGALAGIGAFAAASWGLTFLPADAAILSGAVLLIALAALPARRAPAPPGRRSPIATAVVCGCAAAIVVATTLTAGALGSDVGGTVGAFPTMCLGLTLVVATLGRPVDGAHVAYGLLRSLPCYLTFALVFGLTATRWGPLAFLAAGVSAVLAACVSWFVMSHQLNRAARRHADTTTDERPAMVVAGS
ncbi:MULTISPECIES: hypothetical protein [unclassified Aeromicrobium]|uniref:hypothetical protein n=1 Tax=unclassified Aeromicrobium TaxID=2633570 RepID=UPI00396B200C